MKKITLFFIILLAGLSGFAQVTYIYDAAGNRIRREVTLKSAEMTGDSVIAEQTPVISEETTALELEKPALEEMFGELQIKFYPNPTQGVVYFELNRLPEGEKPELEIWGPTGKLIGKYKITGQVTRINLWGKPGGMYFIKTIIEGKPVTWKIIKE
jgi:hypothetical protein